MDWVPEYPSSTMDWSGVAEMLYWANRFGIAQKANTWLPEGGLKVPVQDLPIELMSDFSLVSSLRDEYKHSQWTPSDHKHILARLAGEYGVVRIERRDDTLVAHFLVGNGPKRESEAQERAGDKSLHDMAMERIQLLRRLFPDYEKYGSQGYGHLPYGPLSDVDETRKDGVRKQYLPPRWPIRLNSVASALAQNQFRPKSWGDYIDKVISTRRQINACLDGLVSGTTRFLERSEPFDFLKGKPFGTGDWDKCRDLASGLHLLPTVCVDRWGFAQPESSRNDLLDKPDILPKSILEEIYEPYRKAERALFTSLTGFFVQAMHVAATNFVVGKMPKGSPQQKAGLARIEAQGIETDKAFLAMHNLNEAKVALKAYQREFRTLLGHRVDKPTLDQLESAEVEVFDSLWHMWLVFTYRPRTSVALAKRRVLQRIAREKKALVDKVDTAIKGLDPSLGEAEIFQGQPEAESGRYLWVRLEVAEATSVSMALKGLVPLITGVYSEIVADSLEYHLCVHSFEHTVVVPTIHGKMINRVAWRMHSLSAINSNTGSIPNFYPMQLTDSQLSELDLVLWEEGEIALASEVNASFSGFILLAAATATVADAPVLEGPGLEATQEFLHERSSELTKLLNTFSSGVDELEEKIKDTPAAEKGESPRLRQALGTLDKLRTRILPGHPGETTLTLSLDDLVDLAADLPDLTEKAEEAMVLWIADSIERSETS